MALDRLTPQLANRLNNHVRTVPFTADEKAELAQKAGVSRRHAENFFAPATAKVKRDLIPSFAVGVPLTSLSPEILARVELALSFATPKELIGTTSHTPYKRKGAIRTFEETFTSLVEALDRVNAFQKADDSVDVYLRHFWTKLDLVPDGSGNWILQVTYRSGAGSPPMMSYNEYQTEPEEDEDEGGD